MNNYIPNLKIPTIPNTPADNLASEFYRKIKKMILDFDDKLSDTEIVGARLASFGQSVVFNITGVGYSNPSLIIFTGTTEGGDDVTLVQHVTQISFLLVAVKKEEPELPKRKIGFYNEIE